MYCLDPISGLIVRIIEGRENNGNQCLPIVFLWLKVLIILAVVTLALMDMAINVPRL